MTPEPTPDQLFNALVSIICIGLITTVAWIMFCDWLEAWMKRKILDRKDDG